MLDCWSICWLRLKNYELWNMNNERQFQALHFRTGQRVWRCSIGTGPQSGAGSGKKMRMKVIDEIKIKFLWSVVGNDDEFCIFIKFVILKVNKTGEFTHDQLLVPMSKSFKNPQWYSNLISHLLFAKLINPNWNRTIEKYRAN